MNNVYILEYIPSYKMAIYKNLYDDIVTTTDSLKTNMLI